MARIASDFGRSLLRRRRLRRPEEPRAATRSTSRSPASGLADREFYLRDNFKPQKERYQKYVADMLQPGRLGRARGERRRHRRARDEDRRGALDARREPRPRQDLQPDDGRRAREAAPRASPGRAWFDEAGLGKADARGRPAEHRLPEDRGDLRRDAGRDAEGLAGLPPSPTTRRRSSRRRFVDAHWEFRSKFLNGAQEQRPRWKRAVDAAGGRAGRGDRPHLRRTTTSRPESKAKMEKLVADLRAAMKAPHREPRLDGPGDEGARRSRSSSKFGVKIGYPTKWRDYSALEVREGDLVGNAERAATFDWDCDVEPHRPAGRPAASGA